MSSSPLGGRLLTGVSLDGLTPIGSGYVRDSLLNNLTHYADEYAQVRVAAGFAASGITGSQGYLTPPTIASGVARADDYYRVAEFGPFPITVTQRTASNTTRNSAYRMRVRIAGTSSDNVHSVTFRAFLSPPSDAATTVYVDDDHVFQASTTSSTVGWLTGQSMGLDASTTTIVIPERLIGLWATNTATLAELAGNPASVQQVLVNLNVWASSTNTATVPHLHAVYAAEYCGL